MRGRGGRAMPISDPGPVAEVAPSYVATRRMLAERLHGRDFDELVLDALETAWPAKVAASELRAHVGGPRWKLQASTERLVRRGLVARVGKTSDTRYSATSMSGVSGG